MLKITGTFKGESIDKIVSANELAEVYGLPKYSREGFYAMEYEPSKVSTVNGQLRFPRTMSWPAETMVSLKNGDSFTIRYYETVIPGQGANPPRYLPTDIGIAGPNIGFDAADARAYEKFIWLSLQPFCKNGPGASQRADHMLQINKPEEKARVRKASADSLIAAIGLVRDATPEMLKFKAAGMGLDSQAEYGEVFAQMTQFATTNPLQFVSLWDADETTVRASLRKAIDSEYFVQRPEGGRLAWFFGKGRFAGARLTYIDDDPMRAIESFLLSADHTATTYREALLTDFATHGDPGPDDDGGASDNDHNPDGFLDSVGDGVDIIIQSGKVFVNDNREVIYQKANSQESLGVLDEDGAQTLELFLRKYMAQSPTARMKFISLFRKPKAQ